VIAYRRAAAAAITATAAERTIRRRFRSCWLSALGTTVATGAMAVLAWRCTGDA